MYLHCYTRGRHNSCSFLSSEYPVYIPIWQHHSIIIFEPHERVGLKNDILRATEHWKNLTKLYKENGNN